MIYTNNHTNLSRLSSWNLIRDWSLITGRRGGGGGATKWEGGGASEVLPLRKGWAEKVLAMLKGVHERFWGSFYAVASSFSHIVGGAQKVSTP